MDSKLHILLAFLLFLLSILGHDESSLSEAAMYLEPCVSNNDCVDTKICHKTRKVCDCYDHQSSRSSNAAYSRVQFYHEEKKKCLSPVKTLCIWSKKHNERGYPMHCVPHAICTRVAELANEPRHFGVCVCEENYVMDRNHLCIKEELILVDLPTIMESGFSGTNGLPSDSDSNDGPMAPKTAKFEDNENSRIDVPKEKLDKLQKNSGYLMGKEWYYLTSVMIMVIQFVNTN